MQIPAPLSAPAPASEGGSAPRKRSVEAEEIPAGSPWASRLGILRRGVLSSWPYCLPLLEMEVCEPPLGLPPALLCTEEKPVETFLHLSQGGFLSELSPKEPQVWWHTCLRDKALRSWVRCNACDENSTQENSLLIGRDRKETVREWGEGEDSDWDARVGGGG